MNTDHHKQLMLNLVKDIIDRHNPSSMQYCLASYILKEAIVAAQDTPIDYATVILRKDEDYTLLTERYQSLMQDFQGKCDELTTTQVEMSDLRNAYCKLQEQFNSVDRAIKGMRGDYNELNNSNAALQRDYDQLLEGFNLLREEANSLREANANGAEILATTKDELEETVAKLIYVTRSQINGIDDDKSRELILTLRDIGVHLGAKYENANTIAAWVKQNVPAGKGKSPRPKPVPDIYPLVEEDETE